MSDLGLTEEEREYVELIARDKFSATSVLGFYVCVVAPSVAFCIYGLVKRDYVAEFVAFAGLILFFTWYISHQVQRRHVYRSVFRKVAQHERESGGA